MGNETIICKGGMTSETIVSLKIAVTSLFIFKTWTTETREISKLKGQIQNKVFLQHMLVVEDFTSWNVS